MFEFRYAELMNWAYWPTMKVPLDQPTIMITGPNGSGKTTFLDALRTLLRVPRLSSNRRFTDYLIGNVETAAIKAVVTNEQRTGERRPFDFKGYAAEVVTLAVILRRRSGKWQRRYVILEGDVSLAALRDVSKSELLPPQTYSYELHEAGFSNALLKVLALEQGQTDKLCEKSPRELLDLLLDVHGDKEIIERYQRARENYQAAHVEVTHLGARLAEEQTKVLQAQQVANAYTRYCRLLDEKEQFEKQFLPQAEYRAAKQGLGEAELAIKDINMRLHPLDREILDVQTRLANADTELEERKNAVVAARNGKTEVEREERELDIALNAAQQERRQLVTLLEAIGEAEPEPLPPLQKAREKLRREIIRLELQLDEVQREAPRLKSQLEAVERRKGKIYPLFVQEFRDVLAANKIDFAMVCDLIDIRESAWQLAVESILGRDRFTVLVDAANQANARRLGERHRYRAYIADRGQGVRLSEQQEPPKASALSVVELLDDGVPKWVVESLARTFLVASVKEGLALKSGAVSVTVQGYRQDRRGGISIAVDRFYCGSLGQSAQVEGLREQVAACRRTGDRLQSELAGKRAEEAALGRRIEVQQALHRATEAAARKAELDREISRLNKEHHQALDLRRQAELRLLDCLDELNGFERESGEQRRWLNERRSDQSERLGELKDLQEQIAEYQRQISGIEARLDAKFLSDRVLRKVPDLDELTPRYYALDSLLEEYEEVPEETAVEVYEHHRQQYEKQQRIYEDHEAGLRNWEQEFRQARQKYMVVVEHTIREYRKNVLSLVKMAGVEADVVVPNLASEENSLDSAELVVRFGYDGKRAQDIRTTGHSGGQRVVSSLILLMSLATSGGTRQGGFFIIDEPFAHLSIERIDDVTRFLERTQCQFILTSPTTHNVNVFSAARLQLNFRIKRRDETLAALPTVIRR